MKLYERIKGRRFSVYLRNGSYFQLEYKDTEDIPNEQIEFLEPIMRIHRHILSGLTLTFVIPDKEYYNINFNEIYLEKIKKGNKVFHSERAMDVISNALHVSRIPPIDPSFKTSAINPTVAVFGFVAI